MKISKILLICYSILIMLQPAFGQVEMADNFRGEGKIYVVIAVVLTLLIGLFIYLIRLERKVSKLENEQKS